MSSHADTITDEQLREWTGYGGQSIVLAAQAALDARAENQQLREALERIGDDKDPLNGYRGAGDFARSTLRDAGEE